MLTRFHGIFRQHPDKYAKESQNFFDALHKDTISEIASWLGLKNASTFSQTCRRMYGIFETMKQRDEYRTIRYIIQQIKQLKTTIREMHPSLFLNLMYKLGQLPVIIPSVAICFISIVLMELGYFGLSIATTSSVWGIVSYGTEKLVHLQVQQNKVEEVKNELKKFTAFL